MAKYRVNYACDGCGSASRTQAKNTRDAPNRCNKCGSSMTRRLSYVRVE